MNIDIGSRLKHLRLKHELTQEELGDRCELTKGFISQLESNQTLPSLTTLYDILEVLGTNFEEFFSSEKSAPVVYKQAEMSEKETDDYKTLWLVSSSQQHSMEPILMTIKPGKESVLHMPHGGEEFGYVIAGSCYLKLGMQSTKLNKGDAFYFKADNTHSIENRGKTPAAVLWVSSPPSF